MSKQEIRQALASGGLSLIVTPKSKGISTRYGKQASSSVQRAKHGKVPVKGSEPGSQSR